jgi:2-methylisocitrate lyase-like PEP mutase family enzyme
MTELNLRALIEDKGLLMLPGVFDGLSARLVKHRGYRAAFITGAGVSESRMGLPDIGLMGLADSLAAAEAIVASTGLLAIADADTGYGNAVNVYCTVQSFERAGVAGIMIEDQVWPKRCGHLRGKEVIPAEEMVQKVAAAVHARRNPNFIVMARTDAFGTHGLDEAVRRLRLYGQAGADLLFADALITQADIEAIVERVKFPICVNMGFGIRRRPTTQLLAPRQLEEIGVSVAIYPRLLTASALRGMETALSAFEDSLDKPQPIDKPDLLVSHDEIFNIMGLDEYERLESRFLTAEQLEAKYTTRRAS